MKHVCVSLTVFVTCSALLSYGIDSQADDAKKQCEYNLGVEFYPTDQLTLSRESAEIKILPDTFGYAAPVALLPMIKPIEDAPNPLNHRSWELANQLGTRLFLITPEIESKFPGIPFAAMFVPGDNRIVLRSSPDGIKKSDLDHEVHHAELATKTRNGISTLFSGYAGQVLEEFYTYPFNFVELTRARRLDLIAFFDRVVLHAMRRSPISGGEVVTDFPVQQAIDFLTNALNGKFELIADKTEDEFFEIRMPGVTRISRPLVFEAPNGDAMGVQVMNNLGVKYIFVTFHAKEKNLLPLTIQFSCSDASLFYAELYAEAPNGSRKIMRSLTPRLLQVLKASLARNKKIDSLHAETSRLLASMKADIEAGGSGDDQVRELIELVTPLKDMVEPPLEIPRF